MAADAVGARGTVVGVDVSLPMLRGALAKAGARRIRRRRGGCCVPAAASPHSCRGALEQMPWFGGLAGELLAQFPARRENLFRGVSLGAPGRLESVLAEAGLRGVSVTTETQIFRFASFDDYWRHVESGAIRIGAMLRELPPKTVRAVRGRVRESVAAFATRDGLAFPTVALIGGGSA